MADAPTASGTLAATPLAHVLVYARNKRLTGSFELDAHDGRSGAISLWRGRIATVKTTPPTAYFGAVVYELGWIDGATLDSSLLQVAKEKRLHGEVLVERGGITRAQRDEALLEQACRKVHALFSFPESSTFAFRDTRAEAQEPPVLLDPLAPAWRGIRDYPPEKSIREVLAKYATATLRVVNESPIERIGFATEEKELVEELLFRPMTIAQLRAVGRTTAARVDLVAYLLLVGKCIEPASPSQATMPAVRPSSPETPTARPRIPPPPISSTPMLPKVPTPGFPPSGEVRTRPPSFRVPSAPRIAVTTPPPSSARMPSARPMSAIGPEDLGPTGLAARAHGIDNESFFETLGVEEGASVDAVRAAYYRLAKVWHPDRLSADLAPLRAEVAAIFAHMTLAHRTLTDPDARRAWLEARATGDAMPKRSRAEVLRDIDSMLAKRDFSLAESESRRLHDADPEDAEALALLAWAAAAAGDANEEVLRASIVQLDRAVNTDRYCDRGLYYRGVLHKRLGNTPAAVRDFARAMQINPKHVDAEREVRLAEMRARKGSGEHALGLFGKTKK